MMSLYAAYGFFVAKALTVLVVFLLGLVGMLVCVARAKKRSAQGSIVLKNINQQWDHVQQTCFGAIHNDYDEKHHKKQQKKESKLRKASEKKASGQRLYVIDFKGDMRASSVVQLREEVTAVLLVANPNDRVLVCLESPGGMVHAYGLAAAQLVRIKSAGLYLIVAVDKVAASGGYMMAVVADLIIAAPFAIIGSVGVVAQLPNFYRWLQKKNVDVELLTAGKYKRTLTMLGENTEAGRAKMQEEIDQTQELFKHFIAEHRAQVNVEKIATGEHWYATQAIDLQLIDTIQTSDDFLLAAYRTQQQAIFRVTYTYKKSKVERLTKAAALCYERFLGS